MVLIRKRALSISASLTRASCLNSLLPLHISLSLSLSRGRLGFLIFTRTVPSSLTLPGANSLPEDRAPIPSPLLPSSTALGTRSIHGIASWFSEGSRLSPTTPDGAPLARSLSRCVFAHWLTHGDYPRSLRPSPRSLSLYRSPPSCTPSSSLTLLFSPLLPTTTPYTLSRDAAAEPASYTGPASYATITTP